MAGFAGMTLYQIFWYFLMYSFIGWGVEVAYHAVTQGKVVNRGFLAGPVCPVYGFGMVVVFSVIDLVGGTTVSRIDTVNGAVIFFSGMLLASTVEFIGGWGLYHAFHARWWDYRDKPFNIGGYVCLEFSIYWGLGALIVVHVVHPVVNGFSAGLVPEKWGWPLMAVLYAAYFADFVVTVLIVLGLNKKLQELDQLRASMRIVSDDLSERIGGGTLGSMQRIDEGRVQAALARAELRDAVQERREETEKELARRRAQTELELSRRQEAFSEMLAQRRAELEGRRAHLAEGLSARKTAAEVYNEQLRESTAAAIAEARDAAVEAAALSKEKSEQRRAELEARAGELCAALGCGRLFGPRRLLKAFPKLTYDSETFDAIMCEVREEIYGHPGGKEDE